MNCNSWVRIIKSYYKYIGKIICISPYNHIIIDTNNTGFLKGIETNPSSWVCFQKYFQFFFFHKMVIGEKMIKPIYITFKVETDKKDFSDFFCCPEQCVDFFPAYFFSYFSLALGGTLFVLNIIMERYQVYEVLFPAERKIYFLVGKYRFVYVMYTLVNTEYMCDKYLWHL